MKSTNLAPLTRLTILLVFTYSTARVSAQPQLREELETLGNSFKENLSRESSVWLNGEGQVPPFISGIREKVYQVTSNTKTPPELELSKKLLSMPVQNGSFADLEQVFGRIHEERGSFISKLKIGIVSGSIFSEYDYFIIESRRLGCWREDTPYREQCNTLSNLGFGLLFAMYESQNMLGNPAYPLENTLKSLLKFISGEQLNPSLEIGVRSIAFDVDGNPDELWNLGYRLNEKSKVFSDYSSANLNPVDWTKVRSDVSDSYKNNFVNQFRNAVDTLQVILNDRKRGWNLSEKTADRIFSLREILKEMACRTECKHLFSVQELYSSLGVLHQFYDQSANFIKLDQLKTFRGDLRSEFSQLTNSFWERMFLKIWGLLSSYGTSITGMTISLILLNVGIFLLCLHSSSCKFVNAANSFLRVVTIRGEKCDLYGSNVLVLFIELVCFVYIPTYLGFLLTFLLRAG